MRCADDDDVEPGTGQEVVQAGEAARPLESVRGDLPLRSGRIPGEDGHDPAPPDLLEILDMYSEVYENAPLKLVYPACIATY